MINKHRVFILLEMYSSLRLRAPPQGRSLPHMVVESHTTSNLFHNTISRTSISFFLFLNETNKVNFSPPGSSGSPEMIEHWITLVHEKNALVSEESDLMVAWVSTHLFPLACFEQVSHSKSLCSHSGRTTLLLCWMGVTKCAEGSRTAEQQSWTLKQCFLCLVTQCEQLVVCKVRLYLLFGLMMTCSYRRM